MDEDLQATGCRLIREDGSEWSVRDVELSGPPPRVRAVPYDREGDATAEARMVDLARGDRLEWRGSDGTVAWSMRIPVTTGEGAPGTDEGDAAGGT